MQVFVPFPDFNESAKSLDSLRLNKQILEATQLLDIIFNIPTKDGKERKGWLNHPALIAWKNYPDSLINYTLACINEAKSRGINTTNYELKIIQYPKVKIVNPIWLGDEVIHSSHRSRLLQKGWEQLIKADSKTKATNAQKIIAWYKSFNWSEMSDPNLFLYEYKWPYDITEDSYLVKESVSSIGLKSKKKLIEVFGLNPYERSKES